MVEEKKSKKRMVTLVIIALILAVVSISLNTISSGDSEEVPITARVIQDGVGAGQVGITVLPPIVEDRLAENSAEDSQ